MQKADSSSGCALNEGLKMGPKLPNSRQGSVLGAWLSLLRAPDIGLSSHVGTTRLMCQGGFQIFTGM